MIAYRRVVSAILITTQMVMLAPAVAYGETWNGTAESSEAVIGTAGGQVRLGDAVVVVPAGALERATKIKITKIRTVARTEVLYNATRGGGGYRLEPAGLRLKEGAVLSLPYDERVYELEGGAEGLRSYYYDRGRKRWEALERLGHDREAGVVESVMAQFSEVINGTLSLPENTGPVEVNINSIKGLEAADPSAAVAGIEGLEGNSEGSATFRIRVAAPEGRAGMTPEVAITYSSGGGAGIIGRGFDLQYGSQIAIDTRWGAARYGEKQGGSDRYAKDGVLLEKQAGDGGNETEYRALRETERSQIIHRKDGNYWEVTGTDGRKKTYGKREDSWGGMDAGRKNIWNVEQETDVYGNTIVYKYDKTGTGKGYSYVYPQEIRYTGNRESEGAYRIAFEYEARGDRRLDGRGGYIQETWRRLTGIVVYGAGGQRLRSYRFEYGAGIAGESQVNALVGCDADGREEWRYGFEYVEIARHEGVAQYFAEPVWWGNAPLSTTRSTQSGTQAAIGGGVGIGPPNGQYDIRVSGGGNIASGSGESYSEHTMADMNGDGIADVVWQEGSVLHVRLNTVAGLSGEIQEVPLDGLGEQPLEQEQSQNSSRGGNVYTGVGMPEIGMGVSISKTAQQGTTKLRCSLQDVDGDGLPDIVMSGQNYYYKNASKGGKIQFARERISAGQARSVTVVMGEAERREYSGMYYQQRPLRMWKAPYDGQIQMVQTVTGRGTGIVTAQMYTMFGAPENTRTQVSGNETKRTLTEGIAVGGCQELYYIHDIEGTANGWDDIRGNNIQWNIKVGYTQVRPWYRQEELICYTPPETKPGGTTGLDGLYESTNNVYSLKSNWAEIIKQDNDMGEALRQVLYDNGYFIPLIVRQDDFELFFRSIRDQDTAEQVASLYVYDGAREVYRRRQVDDSARKQEKAERKVQQAMSDRQTYVENIRVDGISPQSAEGRLRYRQKINNVAAARRGNGYAGSMLDGGKTLCLGTSERGAVYVKEEEGKWYYYDQGRRNYEVEYEEDTDTRKVTVHLGEGDNYEAEIVCEFSDAEAWPSYITGPEMDALALDATYTPAGFSHDPYKPAHWNGKAKPELENWLNTYGQGVITADQRNALLGCYDAVRVNNTNNYTYQLIAGKDAEARGYLSILERADYLEIMQQCYAADGAGGYVLWRRPLDALDGYIKQITETYQLIKYQTVSNEIIYNPEYRYAVTEDGSGRAFRYTALDSGGLVTRRSSIELAWDSAQEYDVKNEAASRQFTLGNNEVEVTVNSADILYGGHGGWYYGIWMGGERDNPFRWSRLYALMNKGKAKDLDESECEALEQQVDDEKEKVPSTERKRKEDLDTEYNEKQDPDNAWKGYYLVKPGNTVYSEMRSPDGWKSPGEDYAAGDADDYAAGNGDGKPLNEENMLVGNVTVYVQQHYRWAGLERVVEDVPVCYFPYIEGDLLHTSRVGGVSYYEVPGIAGGASSGGGTNMVDLRSSRSEGDDTTCMFGVAYVNNNYGYNDTTGWMEQNLTDVNGDGIADVVQKSGDNTMLVWYGRRGADGAITYGDEDTLENGGTLSKHVTGMKTFGAGVSSSGGGNGSMNSETKSSGALRAPVLMGSIGGASARGSSSQEVGMLDINGDGLPDYVVGKQARLGTGGGYADGTWINGLAPTISEGETDSDSIAFTYGIGASGKDALVGGKWTSTTTITAGIDVGLNSSNSYNHTTAMLLDINGDGLPDQVTEEEDSNDKYISVRFNTGDDFLTAVKIYMPEWETLADDGNNVAVPFAMRDMPVVGTPHAMDTTAVSSSINYQKNYLDYSATTSWGVSGGINMGGTIHITVPVGFAAFTINISLNGSSGVNGSDSRTSVTVRMLDINGDGLPDQVLRIPGRGTYVKLNTGVQVGLLKTIRLPQGGACRLSYVSGGNTTDMPQHRNVLDRVEWDDGDHRRGGQHVYTTRYEYRNGYYDRAIKEFYGFATVITTRADGSTETVQYHNGEYYSKGFEWSRTLRDVYGRLMRDSTQAVDHAPHARPVSGEDRQYGQSGQCVQTMQQWQYDGYGNVTYYRQDGDGVETVYAQIDYWHNGQKYIHNRPERITVSSGGGNLLRRREGGYDDNGALVSLRQYSQNGTWLQWRYEYDQRYGTLRAVQDAVGARVEYVYDQVLFQYIEQIRHRGSGGGAYYTSSIRWDTDWGLKKKETDANRNSIWYAYDRSGRLVAVRTDYDGPDGTDSPDRPAAVKYAYHREAGKNWYAVTENKIRFDSGDQSVITTVAEADGLGRVRRTAKSGQVWQTGRTVRGWNVSGAAEYDGKGRAVRTGQTYFTAGTAVDALRQSDLRMVNATEKEYDSLDRVTRVTLPDGNSSVTRYDVARLDGWPRHVTETTDPQGNRGVEYRDACEQTRRMERRDKTGALLTHARYEYNGIGEMLRAYDAADNPLTLTYDLLGRRLSMESADTGRVEYTYNALGQLEEETNSQLRENGQHIRYGYDEFGRQVKVTYPTLQTAVYEYGSPEETNHNQAGRLARLTDSSGTVEYEYGKLGETVKERKTLNKQTGASRTRTALFQYRGNYLGQMESIVYPDGEEVSYAYDYGGNVTGVTGKNRGVDFTYVQQIGYDEWSQRVYLKMGNGTETRYTYDEKRRWLDAIQTENGNTVLQDIKYRFDPVGNVVGYANNAGTYQTKQDYSYDNLYQLTGVEGETKSLRFGMTEYTGYYTQQYRFDSEGLGNMMLKSSSTATNPPRLLGDPLDYQLNYEYESGYAHRASRIGNQYYRYDLNGSVTGIQDKPFEAEAAHGNPTVHGLGGDTYYTEGGWALNEPKTGRTTAARPLKEYRWDDKNRLQYSNDGRYSVRYTYGEDGQRTGKWVNSNVGGESESLYFGKLWTWHYDGIVGDYTGMNSKHVFVGETRIATKVVYADGSFIQTAEQERQFYYHSDHLGSAQLITDYKGREYERLEYTPYGELWVEKASAAGALDIPYRFTGKERDKETGLYYYGARYLDPRDSRWLSVDSALGEYVPVAPVNDEARKHNQNLPGMGGVFNTVNFHVYHYAGNNPVKYIDPDGEEDVYILYTYTNSKEDQYMKSAERESMNKHIDNLRENGFTVKVIENAKRTDVLAAFKDSEAKLIYVSGHGSESSTSIITNDDLRVYPFEIMNSIPNELAVVIFQACHQGNAKYKKDWQAAIGSHVEFVGWRGSTYAETSRSFNGYGFFSGKLRNMNSYIKDIIQKGRKYIERPG